MDCPQHADFETAERYVAGGLPEREQIAFEEHFFSCEGCLNDVQALQAAQAVLGRQTEGAPLSKAVTAPATWRETWGLWAGLAAAAVLVIAVATWVRSPATPRSETTARAVPPGEPDGTAPGRPSAPPAPAPDRPAQVAPPADSAGTPAPSRQLILAQLAVIVPPRYVPLATRGAPPVAADPFETAMKHYSATRYAQAAEALRAIVTTRPSLAHAWFFLGVSELARGQPGPARDALQRVAESGVQPYADEAHFYLGKAALKEGDVDRARSELTTAVEREAGPEGEAERILARLATLPNG